MILLYVRMAAMIVIPIILLLLPATYFDEGQSTCLSVILFDTECPGCGMTRACMHLIHFDMESAFYYNMFSFIVFPILAFLWAKWFWNDFKVFKAKHL
jgi:Protein of unknown function (DUF2752)